MKHRREGNRVDERLRGNRHSQRDEPDGNGVYDDDRNVSALEAREASKAFHGRERSGTLRANGPKADVGDMAGVLLHGSRVHGDPRVARD